MAARMPVGRAAYPAVYTRVCVVYACAVRAACRRRGHAGATTGRVSATRGETNTRAAAAAWAGSTDPPQQRPPGGTAGDGTLILIT